MNRMPPFPFTVSRPLRYVLMAAAIWLLALPSVQASPWSQVKAPASGPSHAIGGAANGCINGAATLPSQGEGYVSIRRHRNRYYGHPETVRLVKDLGRALSRRSDDLIMVGDLSQPRQQLLQRSRAAYRHGVSSLRASCPAGSTAPGRRPGW